MTEGRVPDVVTERDRLREILVEQKPARDRARDLRHLQAVRHARAVVVARNDVYLRLALQATKCLRVQDAVAVALKIRAERARHDRRSPSALPALRRQRGKNLVLQCFALLPYRHLPSSFSRSVLLWIIRQRGRFILPKAPPSLNLFDVQSPSLFSCREGGVFLQSLDPSALLYEKFAGKSLALAV